MGTLDTLSDSDFEHFRRLIYEQSGIALNDSKKELLRTRLRSRLEREGYGSYREYFDHIKSDRTGDMLVPLLDDISTNLTSFFREVNHFNFLKKILPEWIDRKQRAGIKTWRIWSAGCSTGEESYTLVFTMLEMLGARAASWDVKVLATDLSTEVLGRAAQGLYDRERMKDVPKTMQNAYFVQEIAELTTKQGKRLGMRPCVRVIPEVRKMITFKRLNLMSPQFPFKHHFDFIFCRNVMIYFDKPTQETLVNKFYQHLAPGGYLFIGHSESLTGLQQHFKYIQPTIYEK